jgi:Zn-dependent membrane protease YugP
MFLNLLQAYYDGQSQALTNLTTSEALLMVIIVGVVGFIVQMRLRSVVSKYSKVPMPAGMTGAEIAEKMLREHNIHNVKITHVGGHLTDHFDPRTMTVNLSDSVYSSRSIAAAAVACHECGHAIQHAYGYAPLQMRSALVPIVSFASNIVQWVLLAGVIFFYTFPSLLWIGIVLFAMTTLFSFITLPVEINASVRAISWLQGAGVTDYQTRPMAIDALKWAAYTYVIAALGSLATLLYYLNMARSRD